MSNNPNTDTNANQPSASSTRAKLISQVKNLRETLIRETEVYKSKAKDNFDQSNDQAKKRREEIQSMFMGSVKEFDNFTTDQLNSLKESLEIQIESLRGYANQLLEDDELKLVNSLEATLTNVGDITGSQLENLKQLVNQVNDIANQSTEKSVEIVKARDQQVKEDLSEELTLNKEELSSKILGLQDNFRDEMNQKIERVFMGVTMTKEGINGIIRDTLSRLEENLNRLTEGIDENFSKEVGEAQDLIHEYEGKLLNAIEETQENYDVMMEKILSKHSQKTQESLNTLTSELNAFKSDVLSQLNGLNKEQEDLFAGATKQLEEQISKSKADVIESHGTLKDELEKMLLENKQTLGETMNNLKQKSKENVEKSQKTVADKISEGQNKFNQTINETKKLVDENTNNLQGHIRQGTNRVEGELDKLN